jgi:hypothetical protein
MNRTGDFIAFSVASLGSALLGWAAIHIAAKFERKRAIHLLEEHGYAPNNDDSARQPRWLSRIKAAFDPARAENDPKPRVQREATVRKPPHGQRR